MRCPPVPSFLVLLALVLNLGVLPASPGFAECPAPWYITDANDLIQIKGTLYDNAGNETKVQCTFANPDGAYRAYTGGFSTPPTRSFEGFDFNCPALDSQLSEPIGPAGTDVQVVKNGKLVNSCAFVGQRDAGAGWPYGYYMSSVLKFDPIAGFKSEKGTLVYNLTSGSFIGKIRVVAR